MRQQTVNGFVNGLARPIQGPERLSSGRLELDGNDHAPRISEGLSNLGLAFGGGQLYCLFGQGSRNAAKNIGVAFQHPPFADYMVYGFLQHGKLVSIHLQVVGVHGASFVENVEEGRRLSSLTIDRSFGPLVSQRLVSRPSMKLGSHRDLSQSTDNRRAVN